MLHLSIQQFEEQLALCSKALVIIEGERRTLFPLDENMSRETQRKLGGFAATILTTVAQSRQLIYDIKFEQGNAVFKCMFTPEHLPRYYVALMSCAVGAIIFASGAPAQAVCREVFDEVVNPNK